MSEEEEEVQRIPSCRGTASKQYSFLESRAVFFRCAAPPLPMPLRANAGPSAPNLYHHLILVLAEENSSPEEPRSQSVPESPAHCMVNFVKGGRLKVSCSSCAWVWCLFTAVVSSASCSERSGRVTLDRKLRNLKSERCVAKAPRVEAFQLRSRCAAGCARNQLQPAVQRLVQLLVQPPSATTLCCSQSCAVCNRQPQIL